MSEPTLIATGTDFNNVQPVSGAPEKLPHGTRFEIIIHAAWWNAWIFDSFLGEWLASTLYVDSGAIVKNVRAEGSDIIIECEANAVWVVALIGVIAVIGVVVAISVLGIDVFAWLEKAVDLVKWGAIAAIAILGIYGLTKITSGGKSSQGRSPPNTLIAR